MTNNLKRNQEAINLCLEYSDEPEKLGAIIEGLEVTASFKGKEYYFEGSTEKTNVWNITIKRNGKYINFTYSDSINNTRGSQLLQTSSQTLSRYNRIVLNEPMLIDNASKIEIGTPKTIEKLIANYDKYSKKQEAIRLMELQAFDNNDFRLGTINNQLVIKYAMDYYKRHISDAKENSITKGLDTNKNILPGLYDILCCCRSDYFVSDLKDFCSYFGLNEDSIKDNKLYTKVLEATNRLLSIFTPEEIEVLPS